MTIPNPSLWNPFHAINSKTLPKFMFLTVKCLYLSPWYHAYFILVPPCARKYQIQGWPKTCPQIKFSLSKNYFPAQPARDKVKDKDKVIFVAPRCFHEHLDIFTEVEKPDSQNLIETPFGGRWTRYKEKFDLNHHKKCMFDSLITIICATRFCGQNAPRERISLYQSLSMVFLSDRWDF